MLLEMTFHTYVHGGRHANVSDILSQRIHPWLGNDGYMHQRVDKGLEASREGSSDQGVGGSTLQICTHVRPVMIRDDS